MAGPGRQNEVADDDILVEFFLGDDPAFVAKEISDSVGLTRQGIHERLTQLEEAGYLNSKKPGRDRLYWLTRDGRHRASKYLK